MRWRYAIPSPPSESEKGRRRGGKREDEKQKKQKLTLKQKFAAALDGRILVAARGMCVEGLRGHVGGNR
jgi:hypothetical protein